MAGGGGGLEAASIGRDRAKVTLERGQLAHSTRFMAKAWCWPQTTVRRFPRRLRTSSRSRPLRPLPPPARDGFLLGAEVSLALRGCDCDRLISARSRHMIDARAPLPAADVALDRALRRTRVWRWRRARPWVVAPSPGGAQHTGGGGERWSSSGCGAAEADEMRQNVSKQRRWGVGRGAPRSCRAKPFLAVAHPSHRVSMCQ